MTIRRFARDSLGLTLLLVLGCEPAPLDVTQPIDEPDLSAVTSAAPCGGVEAPACVAACGQALLSEASQCVDGRWTCESGIPVSACPDFQGSCGGTTACGFGYSCVKSITHPIPADAGICRRGIVQRDEVIEACNDYGILSLDEMHTAQPTLMGGIVKVAGRVDMKLQCTNSPCFENECCNTCVGNYVVTMTDPTSELADVNVLLKTESLACSGTTCEVGCSPLQVGDTYKVWGVLDSCKTPSECTMLFMGGCPL